MERLRRRTFPGEKAGRKELAEEIAQIERNARCARRAAGLMVLLTAFAAAGLCYPTILLENFLNNAPPLILNLIGALGVGSLISLLTFAGLGRVYRKKLRRRNKARRQTVATFFEAPAGRPGAGRLQPMSDGTVHLGNDGAA